jgi:23S rRNA (pseudouridine1915-N3)-methyltransferase
MAIEVWWIGKDKKEKAIDDYLKRMRRYGQIKCEYFRDSKQKVVTQKVGEEGQMVLDKLHSTDHLILLDEKGKTYTSRSFATRLNDHWLRNRRSIFLIGGAFGHSEEVKQRANETLALSDLTFPHELARLVLIEQLYRAFTILNNEKYHHE